MKNMFPLRCGSIWTASADRLPGLVLDVRKRTAVRNLPKVQTVQQRRSSYERPREIPLKLANQNRCSGSVSGTLEAGMAQRGV